jgi:translation initiation factor IF-2
MSDDRKLSLGGRKQLGVGKGSDSGQVRQSFSHGRTKNVVVEHKKRKFVKPGTAAPAPVVVEKVSAPKKTYEPESNLTKAEQEKRAEVLAQAAKDEESRKVKEDARKKAEMEAATKAAEEAENAKLSEEKQAEIAAVKAEEEAKSQVEKAAKKAAEEKEQKKVEVEAQKEADKQEAEKIEVEAKPTAPKKVDPSAAQAKEAAQLKTDKKKINKPVEKKKGTRGRGDDRKRGKLTVTSAFNQDQGRRPRSMAAWKRAQAKHKRQHMGEVAQGPKKRRDVVVPDVITVQELSNRMAEKVTDVIKFLMGIDVMATINENLDHDTAELVLEEFGHNMKRVSESDVEIGFLGEDDVEGDKVARAPVVTVMGHVDHGKTSLLDAFRKSDVVAGEAGGITQHIGAYQVTLDGGDKITFLDTPGHEAFTAMRARGASVTDLVILVVAADDGLMPQTIEAIHHAKAAEVPMIIAINKMDVAGANPDKIRQDLLQHEVIVEAFNGDVLDVEVSAKTGLGMDKLQETILLQAELMEVKANPNRLGEGVVVEAQLDKGRGPVSTVLVKRGTLKVGDVVVAGSEWGKVRALVDDHGSQVKSAGPSQPVEILGLNGTPSAGDAFAVVETEQRAREITEYRHSELKKKRVGGGPTSIEDIFSAMHEAKAAEFPLLVKADVQGSLEAIQGSLDKMATDEVKARIIHGAVGGITEADISLAIASKAPVIGFNVRANKQARLMAEENGVALKYFSIIYDLVDFVKQGMEGHLAPHVEENILGIMDVMDVFSAGKIGKAAGGLVVEGKLKAESKARILRDSTVIYDGALTSLRRFKEDVKEVKSGMECGLTLENYIDMKVGDQIEVYELIETARTL